MLSIILSLIQLLYFAIASSAGNSGYIELVPFGFKRTDSVAAIWRNESIYLISVTPTMVSSNVEEDGSSSIRREQVSNYGHYLAPPITSNDTSLPTEPGPHDKAALEVSFTKSTSDANIQLELSKCACGSYPEVWYQFKRFETLGLLNLYHLQDQVVGLEKRIIGNGSDKTAGILADPGDRDTLRNILKDYYSAIEQFEKISQMKRPDMSKREVTAQKLGQVLNEPYYTEAPDALGMLDLSPRALGVEPDSIRVFLTRTFISPGRDWSHIRLGDKSTAQRSEPSKHTVHEPVQLMPPGLQGGEKRPHAFHIPATIDVATRILVSLLAGIFLLIPMIVMSFINGKKCLLITASLFVLLFAITLSITSRATNQELMVATATYAAVLVVFVGQSSGPV